MILADLRELLADAERQGCPDNTRVCIVIPTALRINQGNPEVSAYQFVTPAWGRVEENFWLEESEGELPLQIAIQLDPNELDLEFEDLPWEPSTLDQKLQRYGFLFGKPNLSPQELSEKLALKAELIAAGRDPGWE